MTFFEDEVDETEESARVERLANILYEAKRIYKRPKGWNSWRRDFRCLAKDVGWERIDSVLQWLQEMVKDPFTPLVFSSGSFRTKFAQLEEARKRTMKVEMVPEVAAIFKRLKKRRGAIPIQDLERCLQEQYDFLVSWLRFLLSSPGTKNLKWRKSLVSRMGSPAEFLYQWMDSALDDLQNFEKWSGDFRPFEVKATSKKFQKMLVSWGLQYGASAERIHSLLDEFKHEN